MRSNRFRAQKVKEWTVVRVQGALCFDNSITTTLVFLHASPRFKRASFWMKSRSVKMPITAWCWVQHLLELIMESWSWYYRFQGRSQLAFYLLIAWGHRQSTKTIRDHPIEFVINRRVSINNIIEKHRVLSLTYLLHSRLYRTPRYSNANVFCCSSSDKRI